MYSTEFSLVQQQIYNLFLLGHFWIRPGPFAVLKQSFLKVPKYAVVSLSLLNVLINFQTMVTPNLNLEYNKLVLCSVS